MHCLEPAISMRLLTRSFQIAIIFLYLEKYNFTKMVKRRSVLAGVSGCLIGGGYIVLNRSGSNEETMDTNGEGRGCRNGVTERPKNGTFKFINILHFDELELQIDVENGNNVERIEISSNGETIHTVSNVEDGRQKITFEVEDTTTFDITILNEEGSIIDSAQFYSRCSPQTASGTETTLAE